MLRRAAVDLYFWTWSKKTLLKRILSLSTSAAAMSTTVRLGKVEGHGDKCNEVVICQDWSKKPQSHVIFFGGDVQDYKENMENHRDNHRYVSWNVESTAELLQKKYPDSVVSVIKPQKMHLHTFSVYSNFVESNMFGIPNHSPGQESWEHLIALHKNILVEVEKKTSYSAGVNMGDKCVTDSVTSNCYVSLPMHLIGFSKGCVVLNQLLYDLESSLQTDTIQSFVRNLKSFTWLDGGHSGGSNTWVTEKDVLDIFLKTGIQIFVHVTPYQVKDPMRMWIGKEQKKFVEESRKLGINVNEILHFSDQKGCLDDHFEVIHVFTNISK